MQVIVTGASLPASNATHGDGRGYCLNHFERATLGASPLLFVRWSLTNRQVHALMHKIQNHPDLIQDEISPRSLLSIEEVVIPAGADVLRGYLQTLVRAQGQVVSSKPASRKA